MEVDYRFELTGKTPILFHADDVEEGDRLKAWRSDPKNKSVSVSGDDRSPAWTWTTYLYFGQPDGSGPIELVIPQQNLMKTLAYAGAKVRLGKGQQTFKAMTQSSLFLRSEYCRFRAGGKVVLKDSIAALETLTFRDQAEAVKALGFTLFTKRAAVQQAKHVRVRARFLSWSVEGVITATDPAITDEVIGEFFRIAGRYSGLLDWRPSSKSSPGPYGCFEAKLKRA